MEIKKAIEAIQKHIKDNYNPHTQIVITDTDTTVFEAVSHNILGNLFQEVHLKENNCSKDCVVIYGYYEDTREVLFTIDLEEDKVIQKENVEIGFSNGDFRVKDIGGKIYIDN